MDVANQNYNPFQIIIGHVALINNFQCTIVFVSLHFIFKNSKSLGSATFSINYMLIWWSITLFQLFQVASFSQDVLGQDGPSHHRMYRAATKSAAATGYEDGKVTDANPNLNHQKLSPVKGQSPPFHDEWETISCKLDHKGSFKDPKKVPSLVPPQSSKFSLVKLNDLNIIQEPTWDFHAVIICHLIIRIEN